MKSWRKVKVDSRGRINLNTFKDFLDVKQVSTVKYVELEDGILVLTFYDENGNQIVLQPDLNKENKHDSIRKNR